MFTSMANLVPEWSDPMDKFEDARQEQAKAEIRKVQDEQARTTTDWLRNNNALNMPTPTREMLNDPEFLAIFEAIKEWDVNVPRAYSGYCGANGSHAMMIYLGLKNMRHSLRLGMQATSGVAPPRGLAGAGPARDLTDSACYDKAQQRGDSTFTVVGQELTSAKVVCEWIKLNIETAPVDKLEAALNKAIMMRNAPNRKHAD